MTEDDRLRWDKRHSVITGDRPMPPDALRGREVWLPAGGRALDVACGRGAVAVWLARRGFLVDAVDLSEVGLAAAAQLAAEHGVPVECMAGDAGQPGRRPGVRCWAHDLDTGLPESCPGPYDVIVCQRFRDPRLYPVLRARLEAGGLLALTVLSEVGEGSGPYRAPAGELRAAFDGWQVLLDRERDGEAILLARRPARG